MYSTICNYNKINEVQKQLGSKLKIWVNHYNNYPVKHHSLYRFIKEKINLFNSSLPHSATGDPKYLHTVEINTEKHSSYLNITNCQTNKPIFTIKFK